MDIALESSGKNKTLRGFPFKSTEIIEMNSYFESERINPLLATIDFATGFMAVGGTIFFVMKKRSRYSRTK
jgi:hypothetical protein